MLFDELSSSHEVAARVGASDGVEQAHLGMVLEGPNLEELRAALLEVLSLDHQVIHHIPTRVTLKSKLPNQSVHVLNFH